MGVIPSAVEDSAWVSFRAQSRNLHFLPVTNHRLVRRLL